MAMMTEVTLGQVDDRIRALIDKIRWEDDSLYRENLNIQLEGARKAREQIIEGHPPKVRTQKTGDINRMLRREMEERGGLSPAVRTKPPVRTEVKTLAEKGHVVGRAPKGRGTHQDALENIGRQLADHPDPPLHLIDEIVDAGVEEGFSTSRHGFIGRKEFSQMMHQAGKKTFHEKSGANIVEAHSPDIWEEQRARAQQLGPEGAVAVGRRGEGEEGRKLRAKRKTAQRLLMQTNKEIKDLELRTPSRRVKGVKRYGKSQLPTGKYSPYEVQVALLGTPRGGEVRRRRLQDLYRRRYVLRRYQDAGYPTFEKPTMTALEKRARALASQSKPEADTAKAQHWSHPKHTAPLIEPETLPEKAARKQQELQARQAKIEETRARRVARRPRTSAATMRAGVGGAAAGALYLVEAGLTGGAEGVAEAARTEAKAAGTIGATGMAAKKLAPGLAARAAPILTRIAPPAAVAGTMYESARLTRLIGERLGGYERTDQGVRLKKGMTDLYKRTHGIED